ncbi:MAG: gamma-glutamylcyclotransferase family protein [Cyanobacteriota bacterium]|nr:gamma-glutamylcyclotransferase family protein [Cyanobacteriota bacterium]
MTGPANAADSAARSTQLELVFVYGSLKRGMANHRQISTCCYRGEAQLMGLALYDLGPFPMAIASGDPVDLLSGELYAASAAELQALDRFEGAPRLYTRQRWPLLDGQQVWVYVGRAQQVRFVPQIQSGIWTGPQPRSQRHQGPPGGGQGQGQH